MLEFMVPRADSEAFDTAVFRFLELRGGAFADAEAMLKSEPFGPVVRKQLTLASDAETLEFTRFWSSCRTEHRARAWPAWSHPGHEPRLP